MAQFRLVQTVDGFGQGVVALAADGRFDPCLGQSLEAVANDVERWRQIHRVRLGSEIRTLSHHASPFRIRVSGTRKAHRSTGPLGVAVPRRAYIRGNQVPLRTISNVPR